VLGRDLALAERGVGELPVARAVADGVDVRNGGAATLVRSDALAAVELDADLLEAEALDERPAADGDEHQVGLHRLAVAEVHGQLGAVVVDAGALLAELQRDPAALELLRQLLRGVSVLLRDERVEHLDDRHLAAEAREDRRELAPDDATAEDDEPTRHLLLREQSRRVDAARRVEARNRRPERERARRDDRLLERDVLASVDRDRVRVAEPTEAFHPLHAVRLEEGRDTGRHLLDDAGLPRVRGGEVEPRLADLHAELREALFRLLQRERRLHPRLRRDAADAEAGTAEFRLLLDARDLRAQLGRADRGGVSPGAAPEDGDVDVHGPSLFESVAKRS